MDANVHIDVLLKMRGEMEQELETLRNALAGKQKAIQGVNDTIALLRGWAPEENLPTIKRSSYDPKAISEAVLEIFTSNGVTTLAISEICRRLEEEDLTPPYTPAVRAAVGRIIKLHVEELEIVGYGPNAKYRLKTSHSHNGSHNFSGRQAEAHRPSA